VLQVAISGHSDLDTSFFDFFSFFISLALVSPYLRVLRAAISGHSNIGTLFAGVD